MENIIIYFEFVEILLNYVFMEDINDICEEFVEIGFIKWCVYDK